jgi:hypothetical protein
MPCSSTIWRSSTKWYTVNSIWKHSVFAYTKRERYYISILCFEIARQFRLSTVIGHLARHFKKDPIETVAFSFGISENTVFQMQLTVTPHTCDSWGIDFSLVRYLRSSDSQMAGSTLLIFRNIAMSKLLIWASQYFLFLKIRETHHRCHALEELKSNAWHLWMSQWNWHGKYSTIS